MREMPDVLPFRRFIRRSLNVEFTVRDVDDIHGGEIQFDAIDVSEGGAFLRSQLLFEVGNRLEVSFALPDDRTPVHVHARVVWVSQQEDANAHEAGLGLEFVGLSEDERQRINRFVSGNTTVSKHPDPSPH